MILSVSPWTILTLPRGSPSRSATICASVVSWLCPCDSVPVVTRTAPVMSIVMSERWKLTRAFGLRCEKAPDASPVRSE